MREAGEQCFLALVRFLLLLCYSGCSVSYNSSVCAKKISVIRKWQLYSDRLGHCPEQKTANKLRVWLEQERLLTSWIFFISIWSLPTVSSTYAANLHRIFWREKKWGICCYFLLHCKWLTVPVSVRAISLIFHLWEFWQKLAMCVLEHHCNVYAFQLRSSPCRR